MFGRGLRRTAGGHRKTAPNLSSNCAGVKAIQVFQHAIVGQDLQLVVRKNDAQKKRAVAGAFARLENPRRRRAAMMAVGNIETGNRRKGAANRFDCRRFAHSPGRMADAVRGDEIGVGRLRSLGGSQGVNSLTRAKRQEDRAGLGIKGFDVADAVIFFVRPGEFVLS